MSEIRDNLIAEMFRIFPRASVVGRAAPHECPECDDLCVGLRGRAWADVPRDFLTANCDVLPLLSEEAYVAFLPAFLREGLLEPDQGVAAMLLVNLSSSPPIKKFTSEQASIIVSATQAMIASSVWGSDDPGNIEYAATIERLWSRVDA